MITEIATLDFVLLLLLVLSLPFVVVPLWAILDAANRPDAAWRASGQSKATWLVLLIVFFFFEPIGVILAIVYLAAIRGQVVASQGQMQSSPQGTPAVGAPNATAAGWYTNPQDPRYVAYWDGTRYVEQRLATPYAPAAPPTSSSPT
jgi:hypothetical protein